MKYSRSNATGDAGEYLFAYKISSVLGWPCRLLDIDIGIDAQIEILDEDLNSSGRFLAVQIKSTEDANACSLNIDYKHVRYWSAVETPVLLALVDIKNKRIYWRYVGELASESKSSKKGSVTVTFDPKKNVLSRKHIPWLVELGFSKDVRLIRKSVGLVASKCDLILRQTRHNEPELIEDHRHYLELMRGFRGLETHLHKSKILLQRIRRAVGDCGYPEALGKFYEARKSLVRFMHEWGFAEHEGPELNAFKNEHVETTNYLQLDA